MSDSTPLPENPPSAKTDEATLGWLMERERRMAAESITGDGNDTPEKKARSAQILRELLTELAEGKVFDVEEVLAHWRKSNTGASARP